MHCNRYIQSTSYPKYLVTAVYIIQVFKYTVKGILERTMDFFCPTVCMYLDWDIECSLDLLSIILELLFMKHYFVLRDRPQVQIHLDGASYNRHIFFLNVTIFLKKKHLELLGQSFIVPCSGKC